MGRVGYALLALLMLTGAVGGFGYVVWRNAQAAPVMVAMLPTAAQPTADGNAWQNVLRAGFGDNSTPLPTVEIPAQPFAAPTLPRSADQPGQVLPVEPAAFDQAQRQTPLPLSEGATPTAPVATPTPLVVSALADAPQGPAITAQSVTRAPAVWRPPPLVPPINRDPLGRDHYWFIRPVDSNATNFGLFYYPYGSDGPDADSRWRVHNGIDMPNPIGQPVRAAGDGTVIWAAESLRIDDTFQNSPSYGNVVVIEHSFGYRGKSLYTLYAHLSSVLVARGQMVAAGDVIGQVGDTGRVSGPHVHFEVRLGENRYGSTVNPLLWMVPYVGHGVVAGRIVDGRGRMIMDADITLRNWANGLVTDTTTSYVFTQSGSDVNPDEAWGENFIFADVPVGRYEIIALVDGRTVSKVVQVVEGMTSFVDLTPSEPATPQAITD